MLVGRVWLGCGAEGERLRGPSSLRCTDQLDPAEPTAPTVGVGRAVTAAVMAVEAMLLRAVLLANMLCPPSLRSTRR